DGGRRARQRREQARRGPHAGGRQHLLPQQGLHRGPRRLHGEAQAGVHRNVIANSAPAAMSWRRELVFNLLLSLASIIFCLLAAEIVLRFLPVSTGLRSVPVTAADPIFHFTPNRPFV